jgi:predicted Fe-Mo cluster-binding NifX family protein
MNNRTIIAVAASDPRGLQSQVSAHFGRCPYYVRVEVSGGIVEQVSVVPTADAGAHVPGAMPRFVQAMHADIVMAGGMGPKAISLFRGMGIHVATGADGSVEDALERWITGEFSGIVPCAHDHPDSCGGHHA